MHERRVEGAAAHRPRPRWVPSTRRLAPYLFVLPNLVVFALFTIVPAINGFFFSLYDSNNFRTFRWAGLANYERLLQDPAFWGAFGRTLVFVVGFVTLVVVTALPLAVVLNAQRIGRSVFRAAYFLPVLVSPVVAGLVWYWALDRQVGLVNTFLSAIGIDAQPGWLIDPNLAMVSVVIVGLWMHLGFYAVILLAGLQGIDPRVYEAARIDGATRWQEFRLVTVPLLRPTILVVITLSTINGFQAFDFIYTLTGGGPVGGTTLMVQYIYESAFTPPVRYGLGAAAGVVLFSIVFVVTGLYLIAARRREAI